MFKNDQKIAIVTPARIRPQQTPSSNPPLSGVYVGVPLVVQFRCWNRIKGLFKLYNNVYHACHLSITVSTQMSKMHCHHLKFLVALLNSTDHFVRFSRVLLVVQGRYWYRMKGLFKLYNNGLPCVSSIYYRFDANEENALPAPKISVQHILFFFSSSTCRTGSILVPNERSFWALQQWSTMCVIYL